MFTRLPDQVPRQKHLREEGELASLDTLAVFWREEGEGEGGRGVDRRCEGEASGREGHLVRLNLRHGGRSPGRLLAAAPARLREGVRSASR